MRITYPHVAHPCFVHFVFLSFPLFSLSLYITKPHLLWCTNPLLYFLCLFHVLNKTLLRPSIRSFGIRLCSSAGLLVVIVAGEKGNLFKEMQMYKRFDVDNHGALSEEVGVAPPSSITPAYPSLTCYDPSYTLPCSHTLSRAPFYTRSNRLINTSFNTPSQSNSHILSHTHSLSLIFSPTIPPTHSLLPIFSGTFSPTFSPTSSPIFSLACSPTPTAPQPHPHRTRTFSTAGLG